MGIEVRRGDIVWLSKDTPYHDFEMGENVQSAERPYIVVSNNINNSKCPTVNLASISKQVKKSKYPMHVFLSRLKYNLQYDSVIFAEQLRTVNKSYIEEKVASLDAADMKKFNKAIYIQVLDETLKMKII